MQDGPDSVNAMLSIEDASRLRELEPRKRDLAIVRLSGIRGWVERDGSFPSVSTAIRETRLGRGRFFRLANQLRETGVMPLDELGLYLSRTPSPAGSGTPDPIACAASAIIRSDPEATTTAIIASLSASHQGVARTTLFRAMDRARASSAPTGVFGARMAIDSASTDLASADGRRQRFFALVDQNTGLIPAWTISGDHDLPTGYRTVAMAAMSSHGRWSGGNPPDIDATSPGSTIMTIGIPSSTMRTPHGWIAVNSRRRIGRSIVSATGGTIGRTVVQSGFAPPDTRHRNGKPGELPLAGPVAIEAIRRAVESHNAERASLLPPRSASGAEGIDAVLRAAMDGFPK